MPFALCNVPATFQRLMDLTLAGMLWAECLVYLDYVIIFGCTFEEHLRNLRSVLKRLREANLKVKPSKCALFLSQVCLVTSGHYIGFLLSYSHCCILLTLSIQNRSARYKVTGATLTSHNDKRDIVLTGESHYLTTGVYPWYRAWYPLRRVLYSLQSFLMQILFVAVLITTVMANGYPLPPPPPLEIHGVQAADNWKKFKRAWTNFSLAIELNKKPEPVQVATLLTVIGEEVREVFATFADWAEEGCNVLISTTTINNNSFNRTY